jgi:hypothetical protein
MTGEIQHEELPKTIALRPRFQRILNIKKEAVINAFKAEKNGTSTFILTIVDDHIFIKLPKRLQHYWSPQLHLEVNEESETSSRIYGLFGPNPTVWTMFMFLHFVVATVFFVFAIWAYSNWSLEKSYAIQLFLTLLTIVLWFVLYFFGRMGRLKGKPQMHDLNSFMEQTLVGLD